MLRSQLDIPFDSSPTGYSWDTSAPAYHSNKEGKQVQAMKVLSVVRELKETCLLQISEIIGMPQSSVSGRCSDLIKAGMIRYTGKENYLTYKGRLRKKIVLA